MPARISTPCDRALRRALRNRPVILHERLNPFTGQMKRQESLRSISAKTGIPFTTLSNYAEVSARYNLSLQQAEALARYFSMKLVLAKP